MPPRQDARFSRWQSLHTVEKIRSLYETKDISNEEAPSLMRSMTADDIRRLSYFPKRTGTASCVPVTPVPSEFDFNTKLRLFESRIKKKGKRVGWHSDPLDKNGGVSNNLTSNSHNLPDSIDTNIDSDDTIDDNNGATESVTATEALLPDDEVEGAADVRITTAENIEDAVRKFKPVIASIPKWLYAFQPWLTNRRKNKNSSVDDDEYRLPIGYIILRIDSARDLEPTLIDHWGRPISNPYAVVYLGDKFVHRTATVASTLSPVWAESFMAPVVRPGDDIRIEIYCRDLFLKDPLLGAVTIPLAMLEHGTADSNNDPKALDMYLPLDSGVGLLRLQSEYALSQTGRFFGHFLPPKDKPTEPQPFRIARLMVNLWEFLDVISPLLSMLAHINELFKWTYPIQSLFTYVILMYCVMFPAHTPLVCCSLLLLPILWRYPQYRFRRPLGVKYPVDSLLSSTREKMTSTTIAMVGPLIHSNFVPFLQLIQNSLELASTILKKIGQTMTWGAPEATKGVVSVLLICIVIFYVIPFNYILLVVGVLIMISTTRTMAFFIYFISSLLAALFKRRLDMVSTIEAMEHSALEALVRKKTEFGFSDLAMGVGRIARGLSRIVTGVMTEPFKGYRLEGVKGLVKGIGKGVVGAVTGVVLGGSKIAATSFKVTTGLRKTNVPTEFVSPLFFSPEKKGRWWEEGPAPDVTAASNSQVKDAAVIVGRSLVNGVSGIVLDPIRGARREGVVGFFTGVGSGISGVVGKPLKGVRRASASRMSGTPVSQ